MLYDLADQKQLPFRYILADSVYGTNPEFIEAAESLVGITYILQAPEDTLCWLKQPVIVDKKYKYRGNAYSTESGHPFQSKADSQST